VRITEVRDPDQPNGGDLFALLRAGTVDAIAAFWAPGQATAGLRRLYADVAAVEADYYRRTGIYPIMHLVVLRGDRYRAQPQDRGPGRAVVRGRQAALRRRHPALRRRAYRADAVVAARARARPGALGGDVHPYGLARNRATVAALARYLHAQGLAPRVVASTSCSHRKGPVVTRWLALVVVLLGAGAARADDYPARVVRIVVPWAAGGVADIAARALADRHARQPRPARDRRQPARRLGQDRHPAGRARRTGRLHPAARGALGQTLPTVIDKDLGFDPVADFKPIAQLASSTYFLVVRPSLAVSTAAELIAYARAHPNQLSYGSIGTGSSTHLAGAMLASAARSTSCTCPTRARRRWCRTCCPASSTSPS